MATHTHTHAHTNSNNHSHPTEKMHLQRVSAMRPLSWLMQGWEDLVTHPLASLAYGALVSIAGVFTLRYFSFHPMVVAATLIGFMFIAPLFAAGLTELSRQHERVNRGHGGNPTFEGSLKTLRAHKRALLAYGGILALVSMLWFAVSGYLMTALFGSIAPGLTATTSGNVFFLISSEQLAAYAVSGVLLACIIFIVSVVSVPLIVDRECDAATAIRTSLSASLTADRSALLMWGIICAALAALGFATYLVGMVVIFPLLCHATWYAYRELVEDDVEDDIRPS